MWGSFLSVCVCSKILSNVCCTFRHRSSFTTSTAEAGRQGLIEMRWVKHLSSQNWAAAQKSFACTQMTVEYLLILHQLCSSQLGGSEARCAHGLQYMKDAQSMRGEALVLWRRALLSRQSCCKVLSLLNACTGGSLADACEVLHKSTFLFSSATSR